MENDIEGVAWLLAKGAEINTKCDFGTHVMFQVAQLGYKEIFAWFVENGGDLHAVDSDGQTLATYLEEDEKSEMR